MVKLSPSAAFNGLNLNLLKYPFRPHYYVSDWAFQTIGEEKKNDCSYISEGFHARQRAKSWRCLVYMRHILSGDHQSPHQPICSPTLFSSFLAWSRLESLNSCPTPARRGYCASFLTHKNKRSRKCRREYHISHVGPAPMRRRFVGTPALRPSERFHLRAPGVCW